MYYVYHPPPRIGVSVSLPFSYCTPIALSQWVLRTEFQEDYLAAICSTSFLDLQSKTARRMHKACTIQIGRERTPPLSIGPYT